MSLENIGLRRRCRDNSRKPKREATLREEKLEPAHRIRVILTHEFEPIFKCDDNCSIHPSLWSCSQFGDELLV